MPKIAPTLLFLSALTAAGCCPEPSTCPDTPTDPLPTTTTTPSRTCDLPLQSCATDSDCPSELKCVITAKGDPEQRRCLAPCELNGPSCPCPGDHCTVVSGAQVCFAKLGG